VPTGRHIGAVATLIAVLTLAIGTASAEAATITPTRLDDPPGAGSCPSNCSLRQAILAAGAGGTVSLLPPAPSGTYTLTLGPLALAADVSIVGAGAGSTSVSGGGAVQLLTVASGTHVTIAGLTLTHGLAAGSGSSGGEGGAIASSGALTLSSVNLERNVAAGGVPTENTFGGGGGSGGAISNRGLLTILGGTLAENSSNGGSSKFGIETTKFAGSNGSAGAINNRGTLVVKGARFTGNVAQAGSAGSEFPSSGGQGGALLNSGSARVEESALESNGANAGTSDSARGGAIDNLGALRIEQSTLSANVAAGSGTARGEGGAIESGGALTIDRSTLTFNSAQGTGSEGGAIQAFSAVTVNASTLSGNNAGSGGAIENDSSLEATNTTIAANRATSEGGGILNFASVDLANVTLAGNSAAAGKGGNIANFGASVLLHDTVVAQGVVTGGTGGENCAGSGFISQGYNLEDRNQCELSGPGDLVNASNPFAGGLAANGGPAETIALSAGGPAIDAGDPGGCTNPLGEPVTVDERGIPRPQGPRCDIGAYELAVAAPAPSAPVALVSSPVVAAALPAISGLRVSPSPFRAAASGPTIATATGHATGAALTYSDTLAARTAFVILSTVAGVRSGKRCVAPPRHKHAGATPRRCTRVLEVGQFTHTDHAGANSLRFSGRVHNRKLSAGGYVLHATPDFAGRVGSTAATTFRIRS